MEAETKDSPKCPVCKTAKYVSLIEKRKDNGIMGPGYSSWVIDKWYSCSNCGIRFDNPKNLKND